MMNKDFNEENFLLMYSSMSEQGIKALAEEFGVSVPEFISNTGISPSIFLNAFSKGKIPAPKYYLIIADHYNVMLDELFDRRLK